MTKMELQDKAREPYTVVGYTHYRRGSVSIFKNNVEWITSIGAKNAERICAELNAAHAQQRASTVISEGLKGSEEGVAELIEAAKWIWEDAKYKAPEQVGPVAVRWLERLHAALSKLTNTVNDNG